MLKFDSLSSEQRQFSQLSSHPGSWFNYTLIKELNYHGATDVRLDEMILHLRANFIKVI
jgi:hypothetical protein